MFLLVIFSETQNYNVNQIYVTSHKSKLTHKTELKKSKINMPGMNGTSPQGMAKFLFPFLYSLLLQANINFYIFI